MKILSSWLKRKKSALCILAGICFFSLFVIINSVPSIKNTGGAYAVKIKHYGIDAAQMERSVTIPLEDALFSVPGVMSVQSSSENSLSNVFVRFKYGTKGRYEAVRDAAQRIYETLPSSAQRPEILSSDNSRVPVWSAAVSGDNPDLLEKTVKPRLESLDGAGEVLVSGTGLKEIYIILDQEKLSALGLDAQTAASALAVNDSVFSGGKIVQQDREIIITVDGRYEQDASSLNRALIPLGEGKFTELSDIALISEREREPDVISRLNGRKTAGIAIMGRYGADLRKLSADIKKEIAAFPLEFTVLSDLGAEEAAAFRSVINAALSGAVMVALISFFLNRKNGFNISGFFCALAIPLICLLSAAALSAFGFPPDRLLLAGIAAGTGTAADAVILCSEKLRKCGNTEIASKALSSLAGPLTAGAATTAAALLPLASVKDASVKTIACSAAAVTIISLIFSLSLLPPLLLWNLKKFKNAFSENTSFAPLKAVQRRIFSFLCKTLAVTAKFTFRRPALILSAGAAITAAAILTLFVKGTDTSSYGSEDSIYAQVEFEGGLLKEEADRLLSIYSEELKKNPGIKNTETGARTGSGSLLISFDPKLTKAHPVREFAKSVYIPGGFVFFRENSAKDRYWVISVCGDEDQKCRELAEELAYLCAGHPLVKDRVLNFKEGSKKLILQPDREIYAHAGIGFSAAANSARLGVYGPVAYKRIDSKGEKDVRIFSYAMPDTVMRRTREEALGILVSSGSEDSISPLRLDSLMRIKEEIEPSGIRRDSRRRTASITVSTKPMDPRRVKKEMEALFKKLDLPPGYSVEFDPEAIEQGRAYASSLFSLALAVLFCYMIIASINESFSVPLFVLSVVPPSLSVPALFLGLAGGAYNSAVACAFTAVSGMTVNAAVLCVNDLRSSLQIKKTPFNIYSALRKKMPALLSTAITTIAGALPFLFLREGANTLIRTLSLVSALGVAGSLICSITIIPSLLLILTNCRKPILQNSACAE